MFPTNSGYSRVACAAENVYSATKDTLIQIEATSINTIAPTNFINLSGQYITNAQRGINIEKLHDGTTKKVLMH